MKYSNQYLSDLDIVADVPGIERLRNSSVLVTGSTGLIGSAVVDALLRLNETQRFSIEVFAAGRSRKKTEQRFPHWLGKYHYVEYDAMFPISNDAPCDYVIHCASNAHPTAYACAPVETAMTNVVGTRNVLEFAREAYCTRVLYVSSSEVYGQREGSELYQENESYYVDPLDSRSAYPASKRLAETLCAAYSVEHGVDFAVVRPGHVYGPTITDADSRAHAQFARNAAEGRNIVLKSAGNQLRSYCYVMDCVTAMLTVLLWGMSGEAYNISNPNSVVTIRQLAEAMANAGGVSVVFERPSDAEARGYNRMSCSALDSTKLVALGWQGRFDIIKGSKRTVESLVAADVGKETL